MPPKSQQSEESPVSEVSTDNPESEEDIEEDKQKKEKNLKRKAEKVPQRNNMKRLKIPKLSKEIKEGCPTARWLQFKNKYQSTDADTIIKMIMASTDDLKKIYVLIKEIESLPDKGIEQMSPEQFNEIIEKFQFNPINEPHFKLTSDEHKKLYSDKTFFGKSRLFYALFIKGISAAFIATHTSGVIFQDLVRFFPSLNTHQIFNYCEQNSSGVCITSVQGVGKSHSIALYALLKRIQNQLHVFYISNASQILADPVYVTREELLRFSHYEMVELEAQNPERRINSLTSEFHWREMAAYLSDLLKKQDSLVIIDQVDQLLGKIDNESLEYRFFQNITQPRNEIKVVLVNSQNNLDTPSKRNIEWVSYLAPAEPYIAQAFFHYDLKSTECLNDPDFPAVALEITGCNLYQLRELKEKLNKGWTLNRYIFEIEGTLMSEIDRFVGDKKADYKARRRRKRAMLYALSSFTKEPQKVDFSNVNATANDLSQRYIIHTRDGYIKPLFPSLIGMLRLKLLGAKLSECTWIFEEFQNNGSVLGFLLKHLVLVTLREQKYRDGSALEFELKMLSKTVGDLQSTKINFQSGELRRSILFTEKILNKKGYYLPDAFNFPAFDAFIVEDQRILAIRIRKSFDKNQIKVCKDALNSYIPTMFSVPNYDRTTEEGEIHMVCDIVFKAKKILCIVFISGDNSESEIFEDLKEFSYANVCFLHLDVRNCLDVLPLSPIQRKIILKGDDSEETAESK